jgi:hypothetical protein
MNKGFVGAIALASVTLLAAMIALLLLSPMVLADVNNDNLTTTVDISSVAPSVGTITCDPATLTPVAGANTSIRCYATITDQNGYDDIDQNGLNVTLWQNSVDRRDNDDLNTHYSNGTSSFRGTDCTWSGASGTDIDVSCNFTTRFFITPGTATWNVNMSINDTSGNFNSSEKDDYNVATHLGLNVVENTLDFGAAALGEEKNDTATIENWCNQIIDITLAETNTTGASAGELACGLGVIDTDGGSEGIRYNASSTALWGSNMEPLTADPGTNYNEWSQAYTNANGIQDTVQSDTLYFSLRVPASGVSGVCTGTTRITVKIDE